MSGRLWTLNDHLRIPRWQVWMATKDNRPDPKDHVEAFDWEKQQLKTRLWDGDKYKTLTVLIDHHTSTIASYRLSGMSNDEIAVAFGVTRQCIDRRVRQMMGRPTRAKRSSPIPVLQV